MVFEMRKQLILALALVFPFFLMSQTVMVEGYVYETGNRGYLQQATVTILDNATKAIKGEVFTDEAGVFKMGLPAGVEYLIRVEKKPFEKMEKVVSTIGKGEGEKVFVKYEVKRMPGYNFEVTLAPMRSDEDVVVDAIVGARIEVYNNTTDKEVMSIEKSTQHVFNVRFEQGNHYTVLIRKEGYFHKRLEAYVNVKGCILCFDGVGDVKPGVADVLTEGFEMGTLLANVEMIPIELNKEITIENIYYDYNSSRIKTAAKKELDKLVVLLKDNNNLLVEIGSHTDSRGDSKYNQGLSQKRAQSVVNYLSKNGIVKQNLIPRGYGESKLVNRCGNGVECSERRHQQNRRTELKVVGFVNKSQTDNRSLVELKEEEKFERMLAELEGSEIKVKEGETVPDEIKNQKDTRKDVEQKIETVKEKTKTTAIQRPEKKIEETASTVISNTQRPSGANTQRPAVNKPDVTKKIDTKLPKKDKDITVHNPKPQQKDKAKTKLEKTKAKINAEQSTDRSEEFDDSDTVREDDSKLVSGLEVTSARELKKPKQLSRSYTGYRVEFITSLSELPISHQIFSRHGNIVVEENKDGNFAYLLGDFDDKEDANDFLNNILIKRYPGARVVQFEKGRRIMR